MNNRKAFTIVELLTSIVIIALLLGILLPSITMVRRMAKETAQKAQFTTIDMALEAFKQDYGDYPPSDWWSDPIRRKYCGAQKLAEALVGWDLMGFNPKSAWRADGLDNFNNIVYSNTDANLRDRRGPYLEVAKTNAFRIGDLFSTYLPLDPCTFVLCDVFGVKKVTQQITPTQTVTTTAGTPILYYKANTSSKILYQAAQPDTGMYNYTDNLALIQLGKLPNGGKHKLEIGPPGAGLYFYSPEYKIIDEKIYSATKGAQLWPHRPDTYILISAGADHEFGTKDDILNF
jgi:type II secretory pathway pseudopilin PulG